MKKKQTLMVCYYNLSKPQVSYKSYTDLNIWVKSALSQTLPVLARLEPHLVGSWSEGITGYKSWTASIFICDAEKIHGTYYSII